jgi:hypothetical protein
VLEPVIWHAIMEVFVHPEVILDTIDADYDEKLAEYKSELAYIEQSLDRVRDEWERWNDAYGAGVIDLDEFKKHGNEITRRRKELEVDRDELPGQIERIESIEDRQAYAQEILGLYRQVVEKAGVEPPLELKKQIVRMLVDTIWVNDQTMTARIDGVIRSTVNIMEISSELQLTRKWRWYDDFVLNFDEILALVCEQYRTSLFRLAGQHTAFIIRECTAGFQSGSQFTTSSMQADFDSRQ